MNRSLVYLWIVVISCGCAKLGENEAAAHPWEAAAPREVAPSEADIVVDLYTYERKLRALGNTVKPQAYRVLSQSDFRCQDLSQALQLALLLINRTSPEPQDYQDARQLLMACRAQSQGALLTGYIQAQLDYLDYAERRRADLQMLQRELKIADNRRKALEDKIEALQAEIQTLTAEGELLKEKIQALTIIEQNIKEQEQEEVNE